MNMNMSPLEIAFESFTNDVANFAVDSLRLKNHGLDTTRFVYGGQALTVSERTAIGKAYNRVVQFLNHAGMYSNHQFDSNMDTRPGVEMLSSTAGDAATLAQNMPDLFALCKDAQVPEKYQPQTVLALGKLIATYAHGRMAMDLHFNGERPSMESLRDMTTVYPAAALNDFTFGGKGAPGMEAFGATVDTVLPDLRMAMTIVLLRPHRGIMSRLMHRRTTASTVVQYVIPYDELYDLAKSQDATGAVRNSYEHRVPILQLYRKPDPANMTLIPIVPMKANDDDNVLVSDGIIRFNVEADLFDLSMDATKVGFKNINYTDLVSDGVQLDKVYVTFTNKATPAVSESFVFDVSQSGVARLQMQQNTRDSGDRASNGTVHFSLDSKSKTAAGADTVLFANVQGTDTVILVLDLAPRISLKTAIASAMGTGRILARSTVKDVPPSQELKDLVAGLTITLDGYQLDAKFSEENLRKTTLAVRSATKTAAYEIPVGRSIIVDYSMQQAIPEHILATAQEVQAIGIDYRNLNMFVKLMREVHDRCRMEQNDSMFVINSNGERINDRYISGQRVNPWIYLGSVDLKEIKNLRSSDMAGDTRQFMESSLNKIISYLHQKSLIVQQYDNGEIPTYKVLSSGPIIENLLSIPHIHNHLMPQGQEGERIYSVKTPGEPIEYTRVLPSGVRLQCITTTFEAFKDKIIILPIRPDQPESEINFGHNWDFGQFVAHYTPVNENQVNKRVFQNTREFPIITCPVGIILDVTNLDKVLPDVGTVIDLSSNA